MPVLRLIQERSENSSDDLGDLLDAAKTHTTKASENFVCKELEESEHDEINSHELEVEDKHRTFPKGSWKPISMKLDKTNVL